MTQQTFITTARYLRAFGLPFWCLHPGSIPQSAVPIVAWRRLLP